jgi:hypothetical protein
MSLLAWLLCETTIFPAWGQQGHDPEEFGRKLAIVGQLGGGPAMDVTLAGGYLYAIGSGQLMVASLEDPRAPRIVGRLDGLGNVRQIVVRGKVAYITAREDGLFLVDISRPERPALLYHYDTIELATGLDVTDTMAFVTCRQNGVEIIDVRDPRRPVHLSTVRAGESQSVKYRNGLIYVGTWVSRNVVICDVSDPRHPRILSRAPADGYSDGVDVRGNYLFAATGHHAQPVPHKNPGDPGYGHMHGLKAGDPGFGEGHGLDVFYAEDPYRPYLIGRVKFPPWYRLTFDLWEVQATDRHAVIADTGNGIFLVDISNPAKMRVLGHCQLPVAPSKGDHSPAAGIAIGDGYVYVAGAWSDVHVVHAPEVTRVVPEADRGVVIPPSAGRPKDPRYTVYDAGGQVYAATPVGNGKALVAAGSSGLHHIALRPEPKLLSRISTEGIAMDVKARDGRVYVAEGMGGLSIWKLDAAGKFTRIGRYLVPGQSIKQVMVPAPGKYALVHVGMNQLRIVDVSDPAKPTSVLEDTKVSLFYGHPIMEGLTEGRYAVVRWFIEGLFWYDLSGLPRFSGDQYPRTELVAKEGGSNLALDQKGPGIGARFETGDGAAIVGDRVLVMHQGKYVLVDRQERRPLDQLSRYGVGGYLQGKPTLVGRTLYVSSHYTGRVSAVDITNLHDPKLIGHLDLPEHPGLVTADGDLALVPAGYQGLLLWRGVQRN